MTLEALIDRLRLLWNTPHRYQRGVVCHVHEDFFDDDGNEIRLRVMIQVVPNRRNPT